MRVSSARCSYCSSPVPAGARFCRACGAEQGAGGEQTQVQAHEPPRNDPPRPAVPAAEAPRRGGPPLLVVALLVLVFGLAGGVGGYLLLVKPEDDRPSSAQAPRERFDDSGSQAAPPAPATDPSDEEQGTSPDRPEDRSEPAAPDYRLADRSAFTVEVPDSWRLTDDEVDKGYGIRNTWTGTGGASVLVDYTRDFDGTSEASARKLRRNAAKLAGYEEISFGQVTLGDNDWFEWHFIERGEEKVDYFTDACGTGYALLGAAPTGGFDDVADDFRHAAETFSPSC